MHTFTFDHPKLDEWQRRAYYDPERDVVYLPGFMVADETFVGLLAEEDGVRPCRRGGHLYFPAWWLEEVCRETDDHEMARAIRAAVGTLRRMWAERQ